MYVLKAADLEAKGLLADTASELIYRGRVLSRGTTFPKANSVQALESCKATINSGLFCIIIEYDDRYMLWYEKPASTAAKTVVTGDPVQPVPVPRDQPSSPPAPQPLQTQSRPVSQPAPAQGPLSGAGHPPPKPKTSGGVVMYRGRPITTPISTPKGITTSPPATSDTSKPRTSSGFFSRLFKSTPSQPTPSPTPKSDGPSYRGVPIGNKSATATTAPIDTSSDMYRGFFENAKEGMFQTKPNGDYISANPALAGIYGYDSPEDLIQELKSTTLYTDPTRRQDFVKLLQDHDFIQNFESEVRRKDGRVIRISEDARVVRDAGGQVICYEGTVRDITYRVQDNNTLLGSRYQLLKPLGAGGFGQTYLARDMHRPNQPSCVVKKLAVENKDPQFLEMARRLFYAEADTLERLGKHDQITQLLAYFEEDGAFYLVQEYVEGHSLESELASGIKFSESKTLAILRDLLQVVHFVHEQDVIHRDIKPSNIIRRTSDDKLVLIDFGAVKQIQSEFSSKPGQRSTGTVAIGTPGYMPIEQCAGRPRKTSDIYACGIIAIQALTNVVPEKLKHDPQTDEIIWSDTTSIGERLVAIVDKMVRYHFAERYQAIAEVLEDLEAYARSTT